MSVASFQVSHREISSVGFQFTRNGVGREGRVQLRPERTWSPVLNYGGDVWARESGAEARGVQTLCEG